jgi:hypothetical protein
MANLLLQLEEAMNELFEAYSQKPKDQLKIKRLEKLIEQLKEEYSNRHFNELEDYDFDN